MTFPFIRLTAYGMFHQPLKFFKYVRLAFKGLNINRNSLYNMYNGNVNQTFFYVGVHNDEHLYLLSQKAGPSGKLVVFTSTKKSCDQILRLKKNLGMRNLMIAPVTFSIASNEVVFAAQPALKEIVNSATLINSKETRSYKKIEICYNETLDNFCLANNMHPGLLEIKLPWHELAVLNGAKMILKKYKPKVIIECDLRYSNKSKILEIFTFLSDNGYKGYFILDSVRIPLNNFDFGIYQNPHSDFYCKEFIFE